MANIIEEKSFAFAIRIVNLYKHLSETKKDSSKLDSSVFAKASFSFTFEIKSLTRL